MEQSRTETLFLLGSSHKTAPLEYRERLAFDHSGECGLYTDLRQSLSLNECLILNTCNRVEIYGVAPVPSLRNEVQRLICDRRKLEVEYLDKYGFWKTDEEVVNHVFEVAAGLDSQMVGETEILGQVKDSYAKAAELKTVGPILNRIFQKSFQAAKWARTNTGISRGQVSIGNVAMELATRVCGDLENSAILMIGSGEVGEKTTQALVSRGARNITVANRTLEKASHLAQQFKGAAIQLSDVYSMLHRFDIIISCTSSPEPILRAKDITPVIQARPTRPLFLIDLAVPRDVEPAVAAMGNVYLYNVDHLAQIANANLKARMAEMDACRDALKQRSGYVWDSLLKRAEHQFKSS